MKRTSTTMAALFAVALFGAPAMMTGCEQDEWEPTQDRQDVQQQDRIDDRPTGTQPGVGTDPGATGTQDPATQDPAMQDPAIQQDRPGMQQQDEFGTQQQDQFGEPGAQQGELDQRDPAADDQQQQY